MTSWSIGIITGGHGVDSHGLGSGMIIPSANAEVGRTNVEIKMMSKLVLSRIDLGFIIASRIFGFKSYLYIG
jgi:hypothetical protein